MKKRNWFYGILLGVALVVLQVINYRTILRDTRIELFGLMIGLIFISLGIWIGIQTANKKQNFKIPFRKNSIYNLSEREMEVLHAMAEGLSNQEIADRLFVSLNTIKTHTSNIYSKLNVERRTQAVQKAREVRLLDSTKV